MSCARRLCASWCIEEGVGVMKAQIAAAMEAE
jgi:hypothetical protein